MCSVFGQLLISCFRPTEIVYSDLRGLPIGGLIISCAWRNPRVGFSLIILRMWHMQEQAGPAGVTLMLNCRDFKFVQIFRVLFFFYLS
jgi:hypothetical protein